MTSAKIISLKGNQLLVNLDEPLNIERIKTMYSGDLSNVTGSFTTDDPRRPSSAQRNLFFALLRDIGRSTGNKQLVMKKRFYDEYFELYDRKISLSNETKSSMSNANELLEIVIEFVFENNIEINQAFNILPKDDDYFLYICCKYRKCMVCGKRADIHHVDALGMGSNRTKAKHLKHHFMALDRVHHVEIEQIGRQAFANKYHVPVDGIKLNESTLKLLNIQGDYTNDK